MEFCVKASVPIGLAARVFRVMPGLGEKRIVRHWRNVPEPILSRMARAGLGCRLAFIFVVTISALLAQTPPQPAAPQAMLADRLHVIVLQGQGATHEAARGLAALTVVEVRDENDKPVEGAIVTFRITQDTPAGSFAGGKLSATARTNAQGQAGMSGFIPGQQPGNLEIAVTAVLGNLAGRATISQRTVESFQPEVKAKTFWQKWKWPILIGAGAAAGGGVWLGTRGGGSSGSKPTNPTIIISPGPIGVGGPG